jgi:DNA-binding MarR family transcriptional regulator
VIAAAEQRRKRAIGPDAAADAAAEHLEAIRKILRDAVWAHAQRLRVPLTGPQLVALQTLVEELRQSNAGLSLSELSRRMGLAHSTVSGIVSRLEQRHLVRRVAQADDRRFVSIELTRPVQAWLRDELPASRVGPVAAAMKKASAGERELIVGGLAALHRLLEASASAD